MGAKVTKLTRLLPHVETQLFQKRRGIVDHPLLVDLISERAAVRHAPQRHLLPRRRTVAAPPRVVPSDHGAMGRLEARLIVARPDDLVGVQAHVGERVDRMHRIRDDLVPAVLQPVIVVYVGVVLVGVIDIADVLLLPDAVRDAQDVVDDIDVRVLKPGHRLDALGPRVHQPVIGAALRGERDAIVRRHETPRSRLLEFGNHLSPPFWYDSHERAACA